jgi:two-component system invasion response regulator UvrY
MKNVLLIDDHALLRRGIKSILRDNYPGIDVSEAGTSSQAEEILEKEKWDMIILDINLPGRGGLDLLKDIKKRDHKIPVLLLSMYPECQFAVRGFRAGAAGYLCKDSAPEDLIAAINRIKGGTYFISPSAVKFLTECLNESPDVSPHQKLSDREYQIFLMIASGKTVSKIAEELSLSVKTISTVRTHILEKMNLKNNTEIICYAISNQLIM